MKKTICLLLLLVSITIAKAQRPDAGIPHYKLLSKDSTYFTEKNLKKGQPVMIIYFAPDCPHCQKLTFEMQDEFKKEKKNHTNTLKKAQVIMATFAELRSIQAFYKEYDLAKYPAIKLGTEGHTYTLLTAFHVKSTPYVAIYGKNGQLSKAFDKPVPLEDILEALKKV